MFGLEESEKQNFAVDFMLRHGDGINRWIEENIEQFRNDQWALECFAVLLIKKTYQLGEILHQMEPGSGFAEYIKLH